MKQLQQNIKQNNTMQHTTITTMSYRITPGTVPQLQHIELFYPNVHIQLSYMPELIFFSLMSLCFLFLLLARAFCYVANTYTANTKNKQKNIYTDQITT